MRDALFEIRPCPSGVGFHLDARLLAEPIWYHSEEDALAVAAQARRCKWTEVRLLDACGRLVKRQALGPGEA